MNIKMLILNDFDILVYSLIIMPVLNAAIPES